MEKNGWKKLNDVMVRKGMKGGWWEVVVKKEDGKVVKMIGKVVEKFLSEEEVEW